MSHRHEIRVRYGETDRMGVVHHSVYPLYFEEARTELLRSLGVRYADLEASGYLLPLTGFEVEFRRGPGYDDVLVVEARLTAATKVRLTLDYRVFDRAGGGLLARGTTRHACTGPDLRPRRLPAEIFARISAAVEAVSSEDPGPGRV